MTALVAFSAVNGCAPPVANMDLYDAIRTARLEQVDAYLADGGDPDGVIQESPIGPATPLRVAIYGQREGIAIALLHAGASMGLAKLRLSDLSSAGMAQALTVVLEGGMSAADPSEIKAAIDAAVSFGYYDETKVLLQYLRETGGSTDEALWDAINLAIGRGYDDIARLLLAYGAPPSGAAVQAAALRSSPGLLRYLLMLGADPLEEYRDPLAQIRPRGRNGFRAIDFAWEGYQKGTPAQQRIAAFKISDLLSSGANSPRFDARALAVDADSTLSQIEEPSDRLLQAAQWGMYDVVRQLLTVPGANDPAVLTQATVAAIEARWDDIARLLLESGASPNGGPLHSAVRRSSPGLVRYILDLGADPNEIVDGYTPAQYWWKENPAAPENGPLGGGNTQILYELIASGADVCWLGEHRDEIAQHSISLSTLLNSASDCWPEDQSVSD